MTEQKTYTFAGKIFTLKDSNFRTTTDAREIDRLDLGWFLDWNGIKRMFKVILDGDLDSLQFGDVEEQAALEVYMDFCKLVVERAMQSYASIRNLRASKN